MTISRADTVVGEHFTAASSSLRLRTEIELDCFPSVAALSLQAQCCSGLVAAMHHTIFAPPVARDAVDDSVTVPVRLFQQLGVARVMAVGHQIAWAFPAANVSGGNCPGRTGQITLARQELKINWRAEKGVSIHPFLDFS